MGFSDIAGGFGLSSLLGMGFSDIAGGFGLSSLLGSDEGGFERIPLTKPQKASQQYLLDLIRQTLQYPTRRIAGMTPSETAGQNIISALSRGPTAGYLAGESALQDIVRGRDVTTSPEYAAYRDESQFNENQAVNALRRSQQLRGISSGTPALKEEWLSRTPYASQREGYLADLMKNELNMRATAAPILASMSTQEPLTRAQALIGAGGLERTLTQEENDALFESLTQTLLAPYQLQAPIASNILNGTYYAYQQPQENPMAQILPQIIMMAMMGGA